MNRIAALIPAYNEADTITETVKAVKNISGVNEIIVIDDGSNDDTSKVASDAGANVIRLEKNSGKGAALNSGLAHTDADIILMLDADLGASAVEAERLLEPIICGDADMSIAVIRTPTKHQGGFGCVMKLARWAVRHYGGSEISAPLSGQRAVRREVLENTGGFAPGFGVETALTIKALRHRYRLVEIPLPITHRYTGRNVKGFVHRFKQFVDIARVVWAIRKKEF
ncbi:MAG: glycosyltransferase family 2 protein [Armatimonadota bacterium]